MIVAMGLTIHGAPVEIREKLAVPAPEWPRAIRELVAYPHVEEAAILSTCNRFEARARAAGIGVAGATIDTSCFRDGLMGPCPPPRAPAPARGVPPA